MLFQLGVLTYELGRPDEARSHMNERISILEAHGEQELVAQARRDLEELNRRLAK